MTPLQASTKWNGACKIFSIFYVPVLENAIHPGLMTLLVLDFVVPMLCSTSSIHIYPFTSILCIIWHFKWLFWILCLANQKCALWSVQIVEVCPPEQYTTLLDINITLLNRVLPSWTAYNPLEQHITPLNSIFFPSLSTFFLEGVHGSKNLFSKSWPERPIF